MELGLSLGDASKTLGTFMEKSHDHHHHHHVTNKSLGFCMGLSIGPNVNNTKETDQQDEDHDDDDEELKKHKSPEAEAPIVQLDLLPNTPVQRNPSSTVQLLAFPWGQMGGGGGGGGGGGRGFDVNKLPLVVDHQAETDQDGASSSPNNSAASSFQTDFCIYNNNNNNNNKRDFDSSGSGALGNHDLEAERASSRNSDDDENGCTRKKLRLSKDQSAFLEESFKEHNTLNPKQKLALAKQLNLRPRQVEVWFQNRRARTKLKQTEVDCEYLKRCCETLTEENRRLHKELQELRALKSSNPFYMQLPATTLTMCPSCERVATTTTNPPTTTTTAVATTTHSTDPTSNKGSGRPRFYPFSHNQNRGHQSTSTSEK